MVSDLGGPMKASHRVVMVIAALVIVGGTFVAAVAVHNAGAFTPKNGWPKYCKLHPRSNWPQCQPVTTTTTTTTTTTSPTFTGCVVVFANSPGYIRFEGSCSAANAWAYAEVAPDMEIYPYTGPVCDTTKVTCVR